MKKSIFVLFLAFFMTACDSSSSPTKKKDGNTKNQPSAEGDRQGTTNDDDAPDTNKTVAVQCQCGKAQTVWIDQSEESAIAGVTRHCEYLSKSISNCKKVDLPPN